MTEPAATGSAGRLGSALDAFPLLARVANLLDESMLVTTANQDGRGYRILFVNAAFTQMTGYQASEVIGKTPALLQGPRTDRKQLAELRRDLAAGRDTDGRAINYRKDGSTFEIAWSIRAIRNESNQVTHFFAVQRDCSREDEERAREQRLRQAIEQIADPVVIFGRDGRIVDTNPAVGAWTSRPTRDLSGQPVWRLPGVPRSAEDLSWARRTLARPAPWVRQYESRLTVDGERVRRLVQAHVTPLMNPSGQLIGYVAVARDVTERARLEQIAAAVNLNETLGMVFAGLRHELGNPVNSLKAALAVVRGGSMPPERQQFYLSAMQEQIERMEFLLGHMRSFGLFDRTELTTVVLAPIVERVEALLTSTLDAQATTLTVKVAPDLALWADSHALVHVLLTLLSNALSAVQELPPPRRRVRVTAKPTERRVTIAVEDDGEGFPEADRERIFAPFYTSRPGGTGLGLAIARRLVTGMGGTISASSEPGRGACFLVVLDRPRKGAER